MTNLYERKASAVEQARDLVEEVDLELALEEARVDGFGVGPEAAVTLGVEPADERGRRVVDLQGALDREPAPSVGPPSRIQVGVTRLPLGVDAPLSLPLDPQQIGNPANLDIESLGKVERGLSDLPRRAGG